MRLIRFTVAGCAGLFAAICVAAASEQAGPCGVGAIGSIEGPSTIKVRQAAGAEPATQRPFVLHFSLPLRDLEALREALDRGKAEVVTVDPANRIVLEGGTLTMIDNIVDSAKACLRLRAEFRAR